MNRLEELESEIDALAARLAALRVEYQRGLDDLKARRDAAFARIAADRKAKDDAR